MANDLKNNYLLSKLLPYGLFYYYSRESKISSVPYRTIPQQTAYRSKKKNIIWKDLVLKTQFSEYRSEPKMQGFSFL